MEDGMLDVNLFSPRDHHDRRKLSVVRYDINCVREKHVLNPPNAKCSSMVKPPIDGMLEMNWFLSERQKDSLNSIIN